MNRQGKVELIQSLKDNFGNSQAAFLIGYQGLSVNQMQVLRKELRKQGGSLKVAKGRLIKRAVEGMPESDFLPQFCKLQLGVVFAPGEAPAVAKVLTDFAKTNQALKVVVGSLEHSMIDGFGIVRIASLPARPVLLAQLLGTMQAPMSSLVRVLSMVPLKFLWTLQAVAKQREESQQQ
ncbi:50S ribosomal protein L10 [Vermiphilus pyriformis]|jgi:large subunit ribosomal protein L10|uniref:Large ribosomal subunit protein uL10 n=1 Tax=candidate division TM6 bacterium JCVI TM6SC1 TaxID=1306947 RepID=A0A0D2JLN2_9BACT|nr:hypothetical protein J120_02870 [candidate division TM6 bacterium JCVI TM6SC1]UNE35290.1 MAG: 50S ribosomal protein L10 [Vermiphilus pyriformis]